VEIVHGGGGKLFRDFITEWNKRCDREKGQNKKNESLVAESIDMLAVRSEGSTSTSFDPLAVLGRCSNAEMPSWQLGSTRF
jgi:hypothetical protein